MSKPLIRSLLMGAVVAVRAVPAAGADAHTAHDTHLRAGPSAGFPLVAILPAGSAVSLEGCLEDFSWCDVATRPGRGWVDAGSITRQHEGSNVSIRHSGAGMGIGVVDFDQREYWAQHYPDQPWYDDAAHWTPVPRANRPHWPQFPGQPPIRPQPPSPEPPSKPPVRPIMPGPPRS